MAESPAKLKERSRAPTPDFCCCSTLLDKLGASHGTAMGRFCEAWRPCDVSAVALAKAEALAQQGELAPFFLLLCLRVFQNPARASR
jgi:hypothetical protein